MVAETDGEDLTNARQCIRTLCSLIARIFSSSEREGLDLRYHRTTAMAEEPSSMITLWDLLEKLLQTLQTALSKANIASLFDSAKDLLATGTLEYIFYSNETTEGCLLASL